MYRQALVTFIDILGFRDLVARSEAENIKRKLDKVKQFAVPRADEHDEEEIEPIAIQFSDSIVRIRPIDSSINQIAPIGVLSWELLDLVHLQAELVKHRILLRGGVAFGKIYYEGPIVYGPALVAAYDLESKYAVYPRIVVPPDLIAELKTNRYLQSHNHSPAQELEYIRSLVRQNDDGIWFVDYVSAIVSELDDPGMFPDFLQDHKQLILELATQFSSFTSVAAKYIWLAKYHNASVKKAFKDSQRTQDVLSETLQISQEELPLLQDIQL